MASCGFKEISKSKSGTSPFSRKACDAFSRIMGHPMVMQWLPIGALTALDRNLLQARAYTVEGGSDSSMYNLTKLLRLPNSSGRLLSCCVSSRFSSDRFCNCPIEGGSDVMLDRCRFNLIKLERLPISSGRLLSCFVACR